MFKVSDKNPSGKLKQKAQASSNFRDGKFMNLMPTNMIE